MIDSRFKTKSGGILKFFDFQVIRRTKTQDGYQLPDSGGTLLWIPEDVYDINKDVALLLVENHTFSQYHNKFNLVNECLNNNNFVIVKRFYYPTFHYKDVLYKKKGQ